MATVDIGQRPHSRYQHRPQLRAVPEKQTGVAPQTVGSLSTAKALSVALHLIALTAFGIISGFALAFILMVGQGWGTVLGVLLYGVFYSCSLVMDEEVS